MADSKLKPKVPFINPRGKKMDLSAMRSAMSTSTTKKAPVTPALTVTRPIAPQPVRSAGQVKIGRNGLPKLSTASKSSKSSTPARSSRTSSSEPRDRIRNGKASKPSRASPMAHSPHFVSDDDEEDESEARRKRVRVDESFVDENRKIRDAGSFSAGSAPYDIIHAHQVANTDIQKYGAFQFVDFFTTLNEGEEESPIINLQYPCKGMTERYQLVKPKESSDFKPLDEIKEDMRIFKEFYLDPETAAKVEPEDGFGGGLVQRLERHAKDPKPGAQTKFVEVIGEYNQLVEEKRDDGTISAKLDAMTSPLPFKLVNHIIKEQIYARTVSPAVDTVRAYEGFSDNVYGELLPKFLSKIFQEARLTSDQIFVDLGSGVGNCVLQAALEIGCGSWGCEFMPNPSKLALAQAAEFTSRCKMWGIKPGKVRLIQDDFTTNSEIRDVLKRADVVLVNNQAFTPALNDNLKSIFLDLKEGCQIVSLKYFRDPAHRVKESNINDLVNGLSVKEKERYSGMVSWSDDPGKWYIHTKDSTELKSVQARLENSRPYS